MGHPKTTVKLVKTDTGASPGWDYQQIGWAGAPLHQDIDGYEWSKPGSVWVKGDYVGSTRTPLPAFTPYIEPRNSAFRVNGIVFTLDTANSHLRVELDSSGIAETAFVDVNLNCATGTPSVGCVGHSP